MRRKHYGSNVPLMPSKELVIYTPYHASGKCCYACLVEVRIAAIGGLEKTVQTAAMMAEAVVIRKQAYGRESSWLTIIPPKPTNDPHFAVKPQYKYRPHDTHENATEDNDGGSSTFRIFKI